MVHKNPKMETFLLLLQTHERNRIKQILLATHVKIQGSYFCAEFQTESFVISQKITVYHCEIWG